MVSNTELIEAARTYLSPKTLVDEATAGDVASAILEYVSKRGQIYFPALHAGKINLSPLITHLLCF